MELGCGFLTPRVQGQCSFQLFSQPLVSITQLTFLGRIFFFKLYQVPNPVQNSVL